MRCARRCCCLRFAKVNNSGSRHSLLIVGDSWIRVKFPALSIGCRSEENEEKQARLHAPARAANAANRDDSVAQVVSNSRMRNGRYDFQRVAAVSATCHRTVVVTARAACSKRLHLSCMRETSELVRRLHFISPFCSGRESEPKAFRLALAMGEVVQRAGWFFSFQARSSLSTPTDQVARRVERLFSCAIIPLRSIPPMCYATEVKQSPCTHRRELQPWTR